MLQVPSDSGQGDRANMKKNKRGIFRSGGGMKPLKINDDMKIHFAKFLANALEICIAVTIIIIIITEIFGE